MDFNNYLLFVGGVLVFCKIEISVSSGRGEFLNQYLILPN